MKSFSSFTFLVFVGLLVLLPKGYSYPRQKPMLNEIPSKRIMFDQACKGNFNPMIFQKLDRVCDDCYLLYYNELLSIKCRENCFGTNAFRYCVLDLLHPEEEYIALADELRSKIH